jgi:hypothetical protein
MEASAQGFLFRLVYLFNKYDMRERKHTEWNHSAYSASTTRIERCEKLRRIRREKKI